MLSENIRCLLFLVVRTGVTEALFGKGLPPGDAFGNKVSETGAAFVFLLYLSLLSYTFPVFFY